jgi:hypothetical protein
MARGTAAVAAHQQAIKKLFESPYQKRLTRGLWIEEPSIAAVSDPLLISYPLIPYLLKCYLLMFYLQISC